MAAGMYCGGQVGGDISAVSRLYLGCISARSRLRVEDEELVRDEDDRRDVCHVEAPQEDVLDAGEHVDRLRNQSTLSLW